MKCVQFLISHIVMGQFVIARLMCLLQFKTSLKVILVTTLKHMDGQKYMVDNYMDPLHPKLKYMHNPKKLVNIEHELHCHFLENVREDSNKKKTRKKLSNKITSIEEVIRDSYHSVKSNSHYIGKPPFQVDTDHRIENEPDQTVDQDCDNKSTDESEDPLVNEFHIIKEKTTALSSHGCFEEIETTLNEFDHSDIAKQPEIDKEFHKKRFESIKEAMAKQKEEFEKIRREKKNKDGKTTSYNNSNEEPVNDGQEKMKEEVSSDMNKRSQM
eukprot:NODE_770_length_4383_cov_0.310224.p2 type:complete len:270 gc:universal NODE_770_length_4383_cov_0.310224:4358-3549(-)